jgi:hypothetical protein
MTSTLEISKAISPWTDDRIGVSYRPQLDCEFLDWITVEADGQTWAAKNAEKNRKQTQGTEGPMALEDALAEQRELGKLEMLVAVQTWLLRKIGNTLNGIASEIDRNLPQHQESVGF